MESREIKNGLSTILNHIDNFTSFSAKHSLEEEKINQKGKDIRYEILDLIYDIDEEEC